MKNSEEATTTYNLEALQDFFDQRSITPQQVAGELDEFIQHLCCNVHTDEYVHELPNIFYALFALRDAFAKVKTID